MAKLNVLMAAYEAAPFFKRGGLGDVMESLPRALRDVSVDVRLIIPYYKQIPEIFSQKRTAILTLNFAHTKEQVEVYVGENPQNRVKVYFLKNRHYLEDPNVNGKNRKIDQFTFFDLVVSMFAEQLLKKKEWFPDIIHCNDWHTSLVPLILKNKLNIDIPTVLTIHNLNYQGRGSFNVLDILQINEDATKEIKKGKAVTEKNVLGEGILHASSVTTVSPTYAKEIMADYDKNPIAPFVAKRKELYSKKSGEIVGILNGIDYDIWDPEKDKDIFHRFGIDNWEAGKKDNKEDLLKSLGLEEDKPTFCFIGRMASQKGLDVLIKAIKRTGNLNFNLILLGSGNPIIEKTVDRLSKAHSSNIKAILAYDEQMAHRLYAGCDFIIIPSHYEPCGLIQMIAMKYGTLPIASDTGGLKDSILNGKNGFLFKKGKSLRLKNAIKHALNVMKDKKRYKKMVESAMKKDFSWKKSALEYKKLYKKIIKEK